MRAATKCAHQRRQRFDIVIHAAQQNTLAQHRNPSIDQFRASRSRLRGQFVRMIGVERDVDRLACRAQQTDKRMLTALGETTGTRV